MSEIDASLERAFYWRAIVQRKWAIFAFAVVVAIAAALLLNVQTSIYRSTATLLIEQSKAKVAPTEEVYAGVMDTREHFETQVEILKSRDLMLRLMKKRDLTNHPDLDPRQQSRPLLVRVKQYLGLSVHEPQWTEQSLQRATLSALTRRISIEPVRLSQLIRVHFESPDPVFASDMANALAQIYIEADVEAREGMNQRAGEWLGGRLAGLKKNLEASEAALQGYRESAQLIDTKGLAQSGAARQIEDQVTRLAAARQRRFAAEHAYNQVKEAKGKLDILPVVLRNPLVQRLKEAEADSERKVADLSSKYGPEHPRMMQAHAEAEQVRAHAQREIDTVIASLANEYEIARTNEKSLDEGVSASKAAVQSVNRKEFELGSLERAVTTNRQIYELFLNRYRETRASRQTQSSAVARVSDEARPAQYPIKPRKEQTVAIAFVLGTLLGMLVALLLERLHNTLKTSEDVEEKLGQPVLTSLPMLRGKSAKTVGRHFLEDSSSRFSEAIRTARTGVLLSSATAETTQVSVLVTSSVAGEGKTAMAVNLALAQAQGMRVLLIDADLRRPSVQSTLGLDSGRPGLTQLLSGSATFAECLQRVEGTSLYAITSGPVPLNPLELMLSKRFAALLKAVAGTCDMLIIDSPPIHLVSDALVLSKMVNGVVFVVKADSTPYPLVRRCIHALHQVDAKLFGVTLNQLNLKRADRYYGAYGGGYYNTGTSRGGVAALRS